MRRVPGWTELVGNELEDVARLVLRDDSRGLLCTIGGGVRAGRGHMLGSGMRSLARGDVFPMGRVRLFRQSRPRLSPPSAIAMDLSALVDAAEDGVATGPSWIEVVTVDRHGRAYADARIHATPPRGSSLDATTDASGRWKLEDVPELGTWSFQVREIAGVAGGARVATLQGDEPWLRIGDGAVRLRSGRTHVVVVLRPRARFSM